MGNEFQEMLTSYGIKNKPITAKHPQANAICERDEYCSFVLMETKVIFETSSNMLPFPSDPKQLSFHFSCFTRANFIWSRYDYQKTL